jgi:hypothetical protein
MLGTEIKDLVEHIKAKQPIFQGGFVYDPDSDEGFEGIDDSMSNYFYIRKATDDEGRNYEFTDTDFEADDTTITGNYFLVAEFEKIVNVDKAMWLLIGNLRSYPHFVEMRLISAGDDAEAIYREETKGDEIKVTKKIVRIEFQAVKVVSCYDPRYMGQITKDFEGL